jgi:protein-tyrosine phosphatase
LRSDVLVPRPTVPGQIAKQVHKVKRAITRLIELMRQIHPFALWLGHAGDGRNSKLLLDTSIAAVIQLAAEEPVLQLPREIIYCHIPLLDGAGNDPSTLALAVHTVARCCSMQIPTLVCCGGGMSRSPVVTAAALALIHGEPAEKWLKHITLHRSCDVMPGLWNETVHLALDLSVF